jgi:hypothetical protein
VRCWWDPSSGCWAAVLCFLGECGLGFAGEFVAEEDGEGFGEVAAGGVVVADVEGLEERLFMRRRTGGQRGGRGGSSARAGVRGRGCLLF